MELRNNEHVKKGTKSSFSSDAEDDYDLLGLRNIGEAQSLGVDPFEVSILNEDRHGMSSSFSADSPARKQLSPQKLFESSSFIAGSLKGGLSATKKISKPGILSTPPSLLRRAAATMSTKSSSFGGSNASLNSPNKSKPSRGVHSDDTKRVRMHRPPPDKPSGGDKHRLVEYFVVVSSKPGIPLVDNSSQVLPISNKNSRLNTDHHLKESPGPSFTCEDNLNSNADVKRTAKKPHNNTIRSGYEEGDESSCFSTSSSDEQMKEDSDDHSEGPRVYVQNVSLSSGTELRASTDIYKRLATHGQRVRQLDEQSACSSVLGQTHLGGISNQSDSNFNARSEVEEDLLPFMKSSTILEDFQDREKEDKIDVSMCTEPPPPPSFTTPGYTSEKCGDNQMQWPNQEDSANVTPPFSDLIKTPFHPEITSRYPLEDHEDNPLNPMVTHFCHPTCPTTQNRDGEKRTPIIQEVIIPQFTYTMPKIHHFVLTNSLGKKMYGTCLTIWEPYELGHERAAGRIGPRVSGPDITDDLEVTLASPPFEAKEAKNCTKKSSSKKKEPLEDENEEIIFLTSNPSNSNGNTNFFNRSNSQHGPSPTNNHKPPRPKSPGNKLFSKFRNSSSPSSMLGGISLLSNSSSSKSVKSLSSNRPSWEDIEEGEGRSTPRSPPAVSSVRSSDTVVTYEDTNQMLGSPVLLSRIEVTLSDDTCDGSRNKKRNNRLHNSTSATKSKIPEFHLPLAPEQYPNAKPQPISMRQNIECYDNLSKTPVQENRLTTRNYDRTYYLPRCLCILSAWPYLTAFREYLTQLYRLYFSSSTGENTLMSAPLERYIINLCCEIAAPPPGVFEVQCSIFNSVVRFWAPPANQPIAWVSLPFSHLFSCLSIHNILRVWHALTLDRQVLLVSSQTSLLCICSEILISLLFPMDWTNLYIPVLPQFLTGMLDAPMPYLCGVGRANFLEAKRSLSSECIVVDLDENTVHLGSNTPPLPQLPEKRKYKLLKAIDANAGHIFREARCLTVEESWKWRSDPAIREKGNAAWKERLEQFDEAFHLAFTPDSPNLLNESGVSESSTSPKQSSWDAVQEAFLRFYVSILQDYRKFLIMPGSSTSNTSNHERGFRTDAFIKASRAEYQPFLQEFCLTQQFDSFLTKRLYDPGEPDVTFFDQSIDAKRNRSKLNLKKVDTPFLSAAYTHRHLHTIFALGPKSDDLPLDWRTHYRSAPSPNPWNPKRIDCSASRKHREMHSSPKWPETFDESMFIDPRPIPSMITDEFHRQGEISRRLRSKFVQFDESLYADSDPNPEVGTFTVFFLVFSSIVGLELVAMLDAQKQENGSGHQRSPTAGLDIRPDWSPQAFSSSPFKYGSSNLLGTETFEIVEESDELEDEIVAVLAASSPLKRSQSTVDNNPNLQIFQRENSEALLKLKSPTNKEKPLTVAEINAANHRASELEEARDVAKAQLDLAFHAINVLHGRGYPADLSAYKFLIDACGRVGDATRATHVMSMVIEDGYAADNVMFNCLMDAFSLNNLPEKSTRLWANGTNNSDIDWTEVRKMKKDSTKRRDLRFLPEPAFFAKGALQNEGLLLSASLGSDVSSDASNSSTKTINANSSSIPTPSRRRRKKSKVKTSHHVSDPVYQQVILGENLLEMLYPDLAIDIQSETCPHCFRAVSEEGITKGWKALESQDYNTTCPHCSLRFVARFIVSCSDPHFMGSKGKGTPLCCEFLSPWVLRKELSNILRDNGVLDILNPDWRKGNDIHATLWWNTVVAFMRYRLPITFLLQGSFKNRLILPTPNDS